MPPKIFSYIGTNFDEIRGNKKERKRKRARKKEIMLTDDTVSEKSLSSNCIDIPDSCSNSGIRYKISGICPELTSVPLFDLRELLNLKTTLEKK